MKKYIIVIATSILVLSTFNSCEIESKQYDVIYDNLLPKDETGAEGLITAAAYGPFRSHYYDGIFTVASGGIQTMTEMTTDIGDCQWDDAVWPDAIRQNFRSTSNGLTSFYRYRSSLSRITSTFAKIEDAEISKELKDKYIAELHMARGWLSFLLYDLYGPIPIATADDLKSPLQDKILPRPSKEWMVKFIEDEINAGISGVADYYAPGTKDYGRFTKALGYTILMKLYMHEGNWAKAVEMGRELMKPAYKLALVNEYKDIFTLENEKNAEIIFAAQCSRSTNKQLWLAHVLPSNYITKNSSIQKWGGYRVLWSFYNQFDPADKRLESLVGEYADKDGKVFNEANPGTSLIKGALPVKYGEDPAATGEESQVDWVVYRYADILTLLSEALVRQTGSITQEAIDLLNLTRTRAGVKEYVLADFANADDFYVKVLKERGQELWFEGHRRADLIRHGKYIEYARLYKNSTTTRNEFVLMPLPQSAIDEGKGQVIQNPGY